MAHLQRLLAAVTLCAAAKLSSAATIELDGLQFEDSAQVAGKCLKLNGAGVGARFLLNIYLISLYSLEQKSTPEEILSTEGPLRVEISMLRDVSGEDFHKALAETLPSAGPQRGSQTEWGGAMRLAASIASRPGGLRKGDLLTLDWVPGVGTVVEINRKVLLEPIADKTVYAALLNIWIGPKPADSGLKKKLLGKLRHS
jgi:hypothetical protein